MSYAPGVIRDPIVSYLSAIQGDASLRDICSAVRDRVGDVSESSVRSSLNLHTPGTFARTARGRYRLGTIRMPRENACEGEPIYRFGQAELFHADCFTWLSARASQSIHAVVTDPPYGLKEYNDVEKAKLRAGKGGVWRIPPAFDGHRRAPLPRFTVLDEHEKRQISVFFKNFGYLLHRVLVPGGNVAIASNPLLAHLVSESMTSAGFEVRGSVVRLTMTMRGGDRPKNAHTEFSGVSVMPRSMWEPWVLLRKPLEGRVQDNLRKWQTGGWRRPAAERPFGDVIKSRPTSPKEKAIAAHPSLKPQSFLRQLVHASLPLGVGTVLDPFAGSGATLAAANAVGYSSVGIEKDGEYARMACSAIRKLTELKLVDPV